MIIRPSGNSLVSSDLGFPPLICPLQHLPRGLFAFPLLPRVLPCEDLLGGRGGSRRRRCRHSSEGGGDAGPVGLVFGVGAKQAVPVPEGGGEVLSRHRRQ
jgi:hypothetical protein